MDYKTIRISEKNHEKLYDIKFDEHKLSFDEVISFLLKLKKDMEDKKNG